MNSNCVKKSKFSHDWLEDENYKSWIKEIPNIAYIFVFLAIKRFLAHYMFRGMLNQRLIEKMC